MDGYVLFDIPRFALIRVAGSSMALDIHHTFVLSGGFAVKCWRVHGPALAPLLRVVLEPRARNWHSAAHAVRSCLHITASCPVQCSWNCETGRCLAEYAEKEQFTTLHEQHEIPLQVLVAAR